VLTQTRPPQLPRCRLPSGVDTSCCAGEQDGPHGTTPPDVRPRIEATYRRLPAQIGSRGPCLHPVSAGRMATTCRRAQRPVAVAYTGPSLMGPLESVADRA
jgi:hypothetical protein